MLLTNHKGFECSSHMATRVAESLLGSLTTVSSLRTLSCVCVDPPVFRALCKLTSNSLKHLCSYVLTSGFLGTLPDVPFPSLNTYTVASQSRHHCPCPSFCRTCLPAH